MIPPMYASLISVLLITVNDAFYLKGPGAIAMVPVHSKLSLASHFYMPCSITSKLSLCIQSQTFSSQLGCFFFSLCFSDLLL